MKKQKTIYKIAAVFALAAILISSIPYSVTQVSANLRPGTGDYEDCLSSASTPEEEAACDPGHTEFEFSLGNKGFVSVRDLGRERPFMYFAKDFFENNVEDETKDVYKGTFEDLYPGHTDLTNGALSKSYDKYNSHTVTPVQTGSRLSSRMEPEGCDTTESGDPNEPNDPGQLIPDCEEVFFYTPITNTFQNFAIIQSISNADGSLNSSSKPSPDTIKVKGIARTGVYSFNLTCPIPPKPSELPYAIMSDSAWRDKVIEEGWHLVNRNATFLMDFDDGDEWYRYRNYEDYSGGTNPYPEPTSENQSPFTGFFIDKPLTTLASKYKVWRSNNSYGTDTYGSYEFVDVTPEVIPEKDGLLNVTSRVTNYKAYDGADENNIEGKWFYMDQLTDISDKTVMNQRRMCGDFNFTKTYEPDGDWTLEYIGYNSQPDPSQPSGFGPAKAPHDIPRIEYAFEQDINIRGLSEGEHTIYVQAVTKDLPLDDHPNGKNPTNERRYGLVTTVPVKFWKGANTEEKATIVVKTNKADMQWSFVAFPPGVDPCSPTSGAIPSAQPPCEGTERAYTVPAGGYKLEDVSYGGRTIVPTVTSVSAGTATCNGTICNLAPSGRVEYNVEAATEVAECTVNVVGYWNGSPYITNADFVLTGAGAEKTGKDTAATNGPFTMPSTGPNGIVSVHSIDEITVQKDGKSYLSHEQASPSAPCTPGGTANLRLNFLSKPILEVK